MYRRAKQQEKNPDRLMGMISVRWMTTLSSSKGHLHYTGIVCRKYDVFPFRDSFRLPLIFSGLIPVSWGEGWLKAGDL
jgi:hypothetical protein